MSDDRPLASRRAVERSGGLDKSIGLSSPLAAHESVVAAGVLRCRTSVVFRRLAFLRASTDRFDVLLHYAIRPDELIEIPRTSVRSVTVAEGTWVRLVADGSVGPISIDLRPWERNARILVSDPILDLSRDGLRQLLASSSG